MEIRQQLLHVAKTHQLLLHPTVMAPLAEYAVQEGGTDSNKRQAALIHLFATIVERRAMNLATNSANSSTSKQVTKDDVAQAIEHTRGAARGGGGGRNDDRGGITLKVVPSKDIPNLLLDESRYNMAIPKEQLNKITALRQRYYVLYAQCLRSGHYARGLTGEAAQGKLPLVALTSLEGIPHTKEVVILGAITRQISTAMGGVSVAPTPEEEELAKRTFTIEDPRTTITLILDKNAEAETAGIFPCGGVYLARGTFDGKNFHASALLHPSTDTRAAGVAAVNGIDTFGLAPPDHERAMQLQQNSMGSVVIFLAHVHLDDNKTMKSLETFFTAFEGRDDMNLADIAVVLVGDFISKPQGLGDIAHLDDGTPERQKYNALFDRFGTLLHQRAPKVASQCTFVFVPGPNDAAGPHGMLPQAPIAQAFTERVRRWCPHSLFAPNPCRLRFFTHEILIARHDYLDNLRKDVVLESSSRVEGVQSFDHVARTVVDQSHLLPGSGNGEVAWPKDAHLRIFPLPHTILLCDKTEQWETTHRGCQIINPGSFAATTTFLWYTPADGQYIFNTLES